MMLISPKSVFFYMFKVLSEIKLEYFFVIKAVISNGH